MTCETGGGLVGFSDNIRELPRPGVSLAKYGFERTAVRSLLEGDPVRYRITNPDGQSVEFDNYYLKPATYVAAMRNAGFTDFQWIDAVLDPAERASPFWDDFMAQAPFTAFRATKRQPGCGGPSSTAAGVNTSNPAG